MTIIKNWRQEVAKMKGNKREITGYVLGSDDEDAVQTFLLDIDTITDRPEPLVQKMASFDKEDLETGYHPVKIKVTVEILDEGLVTLKDYRLPLIHESVTRLRAMRRSARNASPLFLGQPHDEREAGN